MEWEITVTKADNGFVLSHREETGYNTFDVKKEVIEEKDSVHATMQELLYRIADFFGISHDNYAIDNLNITFDKKGRNVEVQE